MQAGGWGGLCYQTNPSGVMACSFPRIFFLILSPLQVLLSQSQEADRASWVMLRLDGSEQDVCLQPPKQCALPPLSVFFRLYSVCFFFFHSVKIMALDDMTSGIDLKDEN